MTGWSTCGVSGPHVSTCKDLTVTGFDGVPEADRLKPIRCTVMLAAPMVVRATSGATKDSS